MTLRAVICIILVTFFLDGCAAVKFTGKALTTTIVYAGKATIATGKIAIGAVKITGKAVKAVANIIGGSTEVTLAKRGNTLLTNVVLNGEITGLFVVDTGCSETQVSLQMARKMGIDINKCQKVQCSLADGSVVNAVLVNIREIRVGSAKVSNAPATILLDANKNETDGLLGMSFFNNFVFKIDSEKNLLILQKR